MVEKQHPLNQEALEALYAHATLFQPLQVIHHYSQASTFEELHEAADKYQEQVTNEEKPYGIWDNSGDALYSMITEQEIHLALYLVDLELGARFTQLSYQGKLNEIDHHQVYVALTGLLEIIEPDLDEEGLEYLLY